MPNPSTGEIPSTSPFDLIRLRCQGGNSFFLPRDLVPSQQRAIEATGGYEPATVEAIERALHPGMTAVECGANCGYHTVTMARAVGPEGRVLAYEANPELVPVIRRNLIAAGVSDRVELFNEGVWHEEAVLPFPVRRSSLGGAGLKPKTRNPFRRWRSARKVKHYVDLKVRSLEALCRGHDVGLIRMDVEGAELEAITGSADYLAASSATIILEWIPRTGNRAQTEHLYGLLRELGYEVYRIGTDALFPVTSASEFHEAHADLWQGDHCDVLCEKPKARG